MNAHTPKPRDNAAEFLAGVMLADGLRKGTLKLEVKALQTGYMLLLPFNTAGVSVALHSMTEEEVVDAMQAFGGPGSVA